MRKIIGLLTLILLLYSCQKVTNREYYENGVLKEYYTSINGLRDGEYRAYYFTGVPRATGLFSDGSFDGEWRYYYSSGKLQSIQLFTKGRLTNINVWDKNGDQMIKNGNGSAILYDEKGDTLSKVSYQNNKLEGEYIIWGIGGAKKKMYYENGVLIYTQDF